VLINFISIGLYGGQVPQIGLGNTQDIAPEAKFDGVEGINVTHQPLKS
jgi:hypothetical protein